LTNAKGEVIQIKAVIPNTASEALIYPEIDLDITRVYYLAIKKFQLKVVCSYDGWFREVYSDKPLGANIGNGHTTFRIFSPRAKSVKLYLYEDELSTEFTEVYEMEQDPQGVWEQIVNADLSGTYYDFTVHGPSEPGNHFYEDTPVHISDPYARVSVDTWGKCRVWPKSEPASPLKGGIPKMEDTIAYEVHIQDFTDLLPVPKELQGTIPAMHIPGLNNQNGASVGFDYLLDLGVNVLHLMPVQEYLHYPDKEWREKFENDPFMRAMGINEENYQWGYRTSHCFAIESRYRKKGTENGAQRTQFRDMVQAFHDHGIAVIIDIVPNHSAENMEGQQHYFTFNVLDKIYYYRTKDLEHIGEYGNEIKTENRPMVQRWLIDQCRHFIEEFGIDGFRIDLAGQIDEQTLIALKHAIGTDKILYGEPWIGSYDMDFEQNPDWDWYKEDAPITFFQDDARNCFKGPPNEPKDKWTDRGYAGGNTSLRSMVQLALTNRFAEEKTPLSGINYLDIHDNWTLADQFALNNWDGRYGVDEDRVKIAALLLYTSQGPIVTHGGTEMLRSKGVGELTETVKQTKGGIQLYFHGKRDTYNLRKANQFNWENVGKTKADDQSFCDYKGMYSFWRGLNRFRLSQFGKVFRNNLPVEDHYYRWFIPENEGLLGYMVDKQVLVVMNVGRSSGVIQVELEEGFWKCIGNNNQINHETVVDDTYHALSGPGLYDIHLNEAEFKLWVKN
jgi:pullulanase/glycogen debranching enzyme